MLSVRLKKNDLIIKFESFLGEGTFKAIMNMLRDIPEAQDINNGYEWSIPKSHYRKLLAFEDKIAWHNSIEQISGNTKTYLPEFTATEEGLEDLKLSAYPFQVVGISFLHDIKKGILGDEMGLGKTLSAIGAIHRLYKEGKAKKALVISPASLKYQWQEEIEKFTDHKSIVIDGTPKKRKEQFHEFQNSDTIFCLINYELMRNEIHVLREMEWDVITCDEIHRIKNIKSQTSKALKLIDAPYKFGLTGTPMQNKPDELYNVFDWIDPSILGNYWRFRNRYIVTTEKFGRKNVPIGYRHLDELRKKVSARMLRRIKKDVAPNLPKMIINTQRVEMTSEQQRVQLMIEEDFKNLLKEIQEWQKDQPGHYDEHGEWITPMHPKEGQMLGYFNLMIALSDSPEMIKISKSGMAKHYAQYLNKTSTSPKLDELERIVEEQMEAGEEKIVIFTQFVRMQDLIVDRLKDVGGISILKGDMNGKQRQAAIHQFRNDPDTNFFITTDAGNYGINLSESRFLINVELPWNPAVFDQRNGRIHRLNSTGETVQIVNLITKYGIDEKVEEAIYRKKELSKTLVDRNEGERTEMNRLTAGFLKRIVS